MPSLLSRTSGNYGWEVNECEETDEKLKGQMDLNFIPPVVCFERWTMAPSGMDFDNDTSSPWYGDLFVAGLKGGHVRCQGNIPSHTKV